MRNIRRILGLAALPALFAAAGAVAGEVPGRGAEIFQRVCSACHGEKGDGRSLANQALKTPPRDFTTDEARTVLTRAYMVAIVRDGRPHTAMVGRTARLSQDDIEAVVDFVRAAFLPPEPGTALALGRGIYRKSCATCHGDRGQGGGSRAGGVAAPPLSAARRDPDLTAARMAEAIRRERHVPSLPPSGLSLSAADAQAVVAYVRGSFIETDVRRGASSPR